MKTELRNVGISCVANQQQRRDPHCVQRKNRRQPQRDQHQCARKKIFSSKIQQPGDSEGQHQAHALETRTNLGDLHRKAIGAEHAGGPVGGQRGYEGCQQSAHDAPLPSPGAENGGDQSIEPDHSEAAGRLGPERPGRHCQYTGQHGRGPEYHPQRNYREKGQRTAMAAVEKIG